MQNDQANLFAYGHSYVEGAGASAQALCFASLVAAATNATLHNLAVGGSLSNEAAAEVRRERHAGADFIVLMTGLNDARLYGHNRSALTTYQSVLESMFSCLTSAAPRARVVAVEQPRLADYSRHAPFDNGSTAVVEQYNNCLREVAGHFRPVRLARATGWQPATMLSPDSVHPNDLGHRKIAEAILRELPAQSLQLHSADGRGDSAGCRPTVSRQSGLSR